MTQRNGRTRQERRNADELKARRLQPCRRCGQPIDYDAAPGEPDAFNAGHVKSWRDHPELRSDPANLQPEHETCNKSAQHREGRADLGLTSIDW